MVVTRMSRAVPGVRSLLRVARTNVRVGHHLPLAPTCSRCYNRRPFGGENPFTKMEEFMRDMEKKFRRDVEDTFGMIKRDMPQGLIPRSFDFTPQPRFGDVKEVSTPETYRVHFFFKSAKPEDVSVSLKQNTLTVSAKKELVTETSRSCQNYSLEYELPEGLNLDGLESTFSDEGVLTIEAPQAYKPEAQSINIKRE